VALNTYPVFWSDEAVKNKESISRYIQKHWSEREVQIFFRKLEERITLISQYPTLFPKLEIHDKVRRSVLNKQSSIYYKFENDIVELLYIFDNRQNPDKLDLS